MDNLEDKFLELAFYNTIDDLKQKEYNEESLPKLRKNDVVFTGSQGREIVKGSIWLKILDTSNRTKRDSNESKKLITTNKNNYTMSNGFPLFKEVTNRKIKVYNYGKDRERS